MGNEVPAEFADYKGASPKPADFDAFWRRGLDEMRAVKPDVELVRADFQVPYAECLDMFYTGVGGARIHAKLVRPPRVSGRHPAVLRFHGYSGSAGPWHEKLHYAALGFTVAFMDVRGQGGMSQDNGRYALNTLNGHVVRGLDGPPDGLFFRKVYLDAAQLAGIVMAMDDVDADRVGVHGGSQGGTLTLVAAALEPRIKLAAPACPGLCDFKGMWLGGYCEGSDDELREYFRRFDPQHEREDETFTKLGYIDVQNFCPWVRAEVLMVTGLKDKSCPPKSQFAAYNKITSKKRVVTYPDHAHEEYPGHMDRIVQFMAGL